MTNMVLDSITIKGFKSISSIEKMQLKPINITIGPNGSGKSNFIEVFSFLNALREGHLQEYVSRAGGADRLLHFGSKVTQSIEIRISFYGSTNEYEIKLATNQLDQLFPLSESVYYWNKSQYPEPYGEGISGNGKEVGISDSDARGVSLFVREYLASWRLYHFHDTSASSPMKKVTDLNDNRFLRPDGSNLSAFLYFLKQVHKDSYGLIRATIQRVAPFFDDFHLEPMSLNTNKIQLEWKHKNSDKYFDASSLSDGTLRFIALTTLFLQPDSHRPSVILVDEPELGLHPYAITMLASLIAMASEKTQTIISTQSPLLLDYFAPEDVLVADRVNGGTQFSRLDSQHLSVWLQNYSLGQLWEKNELGGRPLEGK